jgi:hypothetical protein
VDFRRRQRVKGGKSLRLLRLLNLSTSQCIPAHGFLARIAWHQPPPTSPSRPLLTQRPLLPSSLSSPLQTHDVLEARLHLWGDLGRIWRLRSSRPEKENRRPVEIGQLVDSRSIPGMSTRPDGIITAANHVEIAHPLWRPPPRDICSAQEQDCRLSLCCGHDDI